MSANKVAGRRDEGRSPWLIYFFEQSIAGPVEQWPAHFARASAMGFDTVCLSGPGDTTHAPRSGTNPFCDMVAGQGMTPMVRIDAPARIADALEQGFGAFRCVVTSVHDAPAWSTAMQSARKTARPCRFLLDALPLAFLEQMTLAQTGFDAALDSGAWWDGSQSWFLEQRESLARYLMPVTFVEDPAIGRLRDTTAGDADAIAAQYVARHQWALAIGHGVSMPMGYEYASALAFSPDGAQETSNPSATPLFDDATGIDIATAIAELNRAWLAMPISRSAGRLDAAGAPTASMSLVLRRTRSPAVSGRPSARGGKTAPAAHALLAATHRAVAGRPPQPVSIDPGTLLAAGGGEFECFMPCDPDIADPVTDTHDDSWQVAPGTTRWWSGTAHSRAKPPAARSSKASGTALAALAARRIAIESIEPLVDAGRFPVKRMVGDLLEVSADIFCDGHDLLAAELVATNPDSGGEIRTPMIKGLNDRWTGSVRLTRVGRTGFTIEAWRDTFASWADEIRKKHAAGLDVRVELQEGIALIERTRDAASLKASASGAGAAQMPGLDAVLEAVSKAGSDPDEGLRRLLAEETAVWMRKADLRADRTVLPQPFDVIVDRTRAVFGAWYEVFPRSAADDTARHGTFDDVIGRLPYIRSMGFDVLYFPPIHPIGRLNRKGPNNSLQSGPGDPGSPYAIGSKDGGHTAIHPELGDFASFARLVHAAAEHGMELALDFAIQCAPDHPWVSEHPEWFEWRPDGSLRFAENPPKKYEDITNVRFYRDGPVTDLWMALRDVVLFWVEQGVSIFRVDNPHTKPYPFWEWLIADVRNRHPDVVFLAEAFTRPKIMARLAKLGFTQSYSYFTWRTEKSELMAYLGELTRPPLVDVMRPNFFVNTPDINPYQLQTGGRPLFRVRAALAATLSTSWGMLAGYELCEAQPLPGREEFLDSEKYQLRARDWNAPGRITDDIARLNRIRRHNPALWQFRNLQFHHAWNDRILVYSKWTATKDNLVLVAVNLDPYDAQECDFEVPLWTLDLPDHATVQVDDLIHEGHVFAWTGKVQHVRLDPDVNPVAIWRVRRS